MLDGVVVGLEDGVIVVGTLDGVVVGLEDGAVVGVDDIELPM